MKKLSILLFVFITSLSTYGQTVTPLLDYTFNGFLNDVNIDYYYDGTNTPISDTSVYVWRQTLEINPAYMCLGQECNFTGNGNSFIVGGNSTVFDTDIGNHTSISFPEINTLGFDSIKVLFDFYFDDWDGGNGGGSIKLEFSDDNGESWITYWSNSDNSIGHCDCIFSPIEIDVSDLVSNSLITRLVHNNFRTACIDNFQLIGYDSENEPPCDTLYITLPPDTVFVNLPPDTIYITIHDTIVVYDTVFVQGIHPVGDLNLNKKLVKITDVLGQEVNENTTGQMLLFIYDDGTIEKRIQVLRD